MIILPRPIGADAIAILLHTVQKAEPNLRSMANPLLGLLLLHRLISLDFQAGRHEVKHYLIGLLIDLDHRPGKPLLTKNGTRR